MCHPMVYAFQIPRGRMGKVRISAKHTAVARAVQGQDQSCLANAGASAGVHRDEESEKPMEAQPAAAWKRGRRRGSHS